jgi:DNA-directed RNA polymerase specialized sigma24 family protein
MSLASEIAPHLPYLRRYARALTGTQLDGDAYVHATLEAVASALESFPRNVEVRLGLYRTFHAIWASSAIDVADDEVDETRRERAARSRLAAITPLSRQALLLSALEGFSQSEVAYLIDLDEAAVASLLREAVKAIEQQTRTSVLIIEDEPIIAMDIEAIMHDLGHRIAGIASTHDEAVALARDTLPGLVLADIQLADDSSGIDAVRDILALFSVPVIFITAFPERLLTGERPEPTFLITKPFQRSTVTAAMAQALFFDSTAPMPAGE